MTGLKFDILVWGNAAFFSLTKICHMSSAGATIEGQSGVVGLTVLSGNRDSGT